MFTSCNISVCRKYLLFFGISLLANIGFSQVRISDFEEAFGDGSRRADVILKFKSRPISVMGHTKSTKGREVYNALVRQASGSQKEIREYLDKRGIPYQVFWINNSLLLSASRELLEQVVHLGPERMMLNASFRLPGEMAVSDAKRSVEDSLTWGLKMINADRVWELGITGRGVVVGGHDTGVYWQHPALRTKYRGWNDGMVKHDYHWHDAIHEISPLHKDSIIDESTNPCGLDLQEPCDDVGSSHGTHTVGSMLGSESSGIFVGVAPGAQWIAVRNMERGYGSVASYLEGFQWFLAPTDLEGNNPDPSMAPDVINNSWACIEEEGCNPDNFHILEEAVNNLRAAGILVVASAGNSGRQGCQTVSNPPAIYKSAFTVGATTEAEELASFSSKGPVPLDDGFLQKPDVVAPGARVYSTARDDSYHFLSGTSMAGPHVAGLVALILEANPALAGNVDEIEDIIRRTAVPMMAEDSCLETNTTPNAFYGHGRIDALAAVQESLLWTNTNEDSGVNSFSFFPNPAREYIHLRSQRDAATEVFIFDLMGRLVARTVFAGSKIWPIDLRTGAYLMHFFSEGRPVVSRKFQIIH